MLAGVEWAGSKDKIKSAENYSTITVLAYILQKQFNRTGNSKGGQMGVHAFPCTLERAWTPLIPCVAKHIEIKYSVFNLT